MAAPVQLNPGSVFAGDFRVERPLAEGGMGAVYVVEQISTGKRRALKVMHPMLAPDAKSRARFVEEARVGARIPSDHVVEVIAAGVEPAGDVPWLAMELLEGSDLDQLVRRDGPLPVATLLELMQQLAHALGAAHQIGIIHRDLKPENLFLARSQRSNEASVLKILDFGIARMIEGNQTAAAVTSAIGSPLWMAPEQAQPGAKLRPATDVWALGLIGFYLLTAKPYWRAANHPEFNLSALLVEAMTHPIDPPSARAAELGATLPPGFDGWFLGCVDRDPARRFPDATAAFEALRVALEGGSSAPRPTAPTQALAAESLPGFATAPTAPLPAGGPRRGAPIGLIVGALVGALGLALAVVVGAGALFFASRRVEPPAPVAQYGPRPSDLEAPTASVEEEVEAPNPAPTLEVPAAAEPSPSTEIAAPRPPPRRDGTGSSDDRAGGGLRGRDPVTPRVRTGNADVRGSLSREAIRRVIARHTGEVRACYHRGLARSPHLEGRVMISFIISPTGAVQTASVAETTLHAPAVESCLTNAARRWTFPAPEGGGVVAVRYPFVFTASG